MNSGLEAFSRNSMRGSFSALTFRSTELPITQTNGSSRTGLDYCRGDNFISRAGFSNAIRLTTVFLTPRQGGSPNNNIPTTPTTLDR
jgi:hypothetical protein